MGREELSRHKEHCGRWAGAGPVSGNREKPAWLTASAGDMGGAGSDAALLLLQGF